MTTKEEYICPKCKHKNRIKLKNTYTEADVLDIISRKVFIKTCKNCGENVFTEYPFKVEGANYIVYFTPSQTKEIIDATKEIRRICDTFVDLKEKLLILNDGLNDIKIEFIKAYIKEELSKELEIEDLRYNNIEDNNLVFKVLGSDKFATFSMDKYNELDKIIKLKNSKKCVLIDEYTYKKYYKMRLL